MVRALTLEEHLEALGLPVETEGAQLGDLDDSKYVLNLLMQYFVGKTTNSSVATYVALETMFKFGWELSELSRLVNLRTLTREELEDANRILSPPTSEARRGLCI